MSKFLPKNREEAFAYQFEDDVRLLHSLALINKESFVRHLHVMQAHIDAYHNEDLQKECANAEKKHLETLKAMQEKYPFMY